MTTPQNPLPPTSDINYQSRSLVDADAEHLKILSICWYVFACLHALAACFLLLYAALGAVVALFGLAAGTAAGKIAHDPFFAILGLPAATMGFLVVCIGAFAFLLFLAVAFAQYHCGRSLSRRRNMTFCYVIAAIACLNIPFGTALGICTFMVLSRPTVKSLFQ